MSNRLINEPSPYLQQHAHNPVEWYPWGDEAFDRARKEQKPIFLSIGYSTCHWCHVMERESFEDPETARLMNEHYVSIKVDREERPDVDAIYMAAAQALTGQGGWPLSAWLTPELKPYYVGTYFPPRPLHGRPSFREALLKLREAWDQEHDRVVSSSNQITEAVSHGMRIGEPAASAYGDYRQMFDSCYRRLKESHDPLHGGFSQAPKFPRPALLEFLNRYSVLDDCSIARSMVRTTLQRMASGGIFDHVGGGFARYSVDSEWRVPHFEKMLYDQGQLLGVLADTYRIHPEHWCRRAIDATIEYLHRDLRSDAGGFFSAEDADSEGVEGKFYVWTETELKDLLSGPELRQLASVFEVSAAGNFEGNIILHSRRDEDGRPLLAMIPEEERAALDTVLSTLRQARAERVRPLRDEKVISAWNGLVIGGLARAGAATGDRRAVLMAADAADFLRREMIVEEKISRRWKDGSTGIPGFLDDYAFVANGLIDLYEATGEEEWVTLSSELVDSALVRFADPDGGGYFYSDSEDPSLILRGKGDYDGAEPAANSVLAMAATRLHRLLGHDRHHEAAEKITSAFLPAVQGHPEVLPFMLSGRMLLDAPEQQMVLAASSGEESIRGLAALHAEYRPLTTLIPLPKADGPIVEARPELREMPSLDGEATLYRCENFSCQAPVKV